MVFPGAGTGRPVLRVEGSITERADADATGTDAPVASTTVVDGLGTDARVADSLACDAPCFEVWLVMLSV